MYSGDGFKEKQSNDKNEVSAPHQSGNLHIMTTETHHYNFRHQAFRIPHSH